MDFEIIVWLVILFFFLLSRLLNRGSKREEGRQVPEQEPQYEERRTVERDSSFEEALQQIREALGEAPSREKPRAEQPPPSRAPQPRPAPQAAQREKPSFHEELAGKRGAAQPRRQQPRAQPQPKRTQPSIDVEMQKRYEQASGHTPVIDEVMSVYEDSEKQMGKSKRRDRVIGTLTNPDSIRDAYKYKEILGPPRSKEPFRPGRSY